MHIWIHLERVGWGTQPNLDDTRDIHVHVPQNQLRVGWGTQPNLGEDQTRRRVDFLFSLYTCVHMISVVDTL